MPQGAADFGSASPWRGAVHGGDAVAKPRGERRALGIQAGQLGKEGEEEEENVTSETTESF